MVAHHAFNSDSGGSGINVEDMVAHHAVNNDSGGAGAVSTSKTTYRAYHAVNSDSGARDGKRRDRMGRDPMMVLGMCHGTALVVQVFSEEVVEARALASTHTCKHTVGVVVVKTVELKQTSGDVLAQLPPSSKCRGGFLAAHSAAVGPAVVGSTGEVAWDEGTTGCVFVLASGGIDVVRAGSAVAAYVAVVWAGVTSSVAGSCEGAVGARPAVVGSTRMCLFSARRTSVTCVEKVEGAHAKEQEWPGQSQGGTLSGCGVHCGSLRTTVKDRTKQRASRLIIHFDPEAPAPKRVDVRKLFNMIAKALLVYGTNQLAGIQWTQNGNLVAHARPGVCSAKLLAMQHAEIWNAMRPVLGLPVKCIPPKFEVDEPWYSVVFHRAPMPPSCSPDYIDLADIQFWLNYGVTESAGTAMAYSVLCSPADFKTRDSLSIRVALSSEADALRLIEDGCTLYGARCRVSRYVPKPTHRSEP
ncbi:hypothetical protein B0H19DRAFT_1385545 [Mycena capillaripes]|nr:hypothetical protein B0H19DRAFT_1385545 [Mycena capillaripes]